MGGNAANTRQFRILKKIQSSDRAVHLILQQLDLALDLILQKVNRDVRQSSGAISIAWAIISWILHDFETCTNLLALLTLLTFRRQVQCTYLNRLD